MRRIVSIIATLALVIGMPVVAPSPAAAAAPGNDDFAAAVDLGTASSGTVTGTNLDATTETGEPGVTETVWYRWTAPSSGQFAFELSGTDFPAELGVYVGEDLASLSWEPSTSQAITIYGSYAVYQDGQIFTAVEGTTYRIQVGSDNNRVGEMGDIVLNWYPNVAPANDDIANATVLTGSTGSTTGTITFATADGLVGDPNLWYRWDAPADGTYRFDTCGAEFDSYLEAFTGADGSSLVWVGGDDDSCGYGSALVLTATSGTRYYLSAEPLSSDYVGDFPLRWQGAVPPANDDLAAATAIGGASGTAIGNTRFATIETDEPTGYSWQGQPYGSDDLSVWWRWTAPSSGPVVFDTCGGTSTDTTLAVYDGTEMSSLGVVAPTNYYSCLGLVSNGSMVRFDAVSGNSYAVRVAQGWGDGADVLLRWRSGAAPANDDFAVATELSGPGGTAMGTNLFATAETDEPTDLGEHSVWWTWTAPSTDPVTFDTHGSKLTDTALAVYTGSSVGSLVEVAQDYEYQMYGGQPEVTFTPVPGTTYHIRVSGNNGGMNAVVLHWPASYGYVLAAPYVTEHPQSQSVVTAASASFSAAAVGNPTPTVQWERSTDGGSTWLDIAGATDLTYVVGATGPSMNDYRYRAVFTNSVGSTTSDAATLTVLFAPSVTTHPESQTVTSGSPASFSAAASGSPAPAVQWERSTDGGSTFEPIAGATSATYTVTSTHTTMSGYRYRAVFTNSQGSATSTAASLTVNPGLGLVTNVAASRARGMITVTFTLAGDPVATVAQCRMDVRRNPTWVACESGYVVKSSAKSVSVRASNDGGTTWGPISTVVVTRG